MHRHRIILGTTMLLLGTLLAWYVQTGGGVVKVRDVRLVGNQGETISALLFVPDGISATNKAPGILAIHGYINTRETQSGFSIELARRGFVVLAPDQTGHGSSDPPAFADGFGGPAALAYLRSLPFVDTTRIGLEGHSMGGWAVQMAAASDPNGYKAMVLEGSSTGSFGTPEGTPASPRNLLLVYSRFDEFSQLMWGSAIPADVVKTEKLKKLFGTSHDVVPGKHYGSVQQGTARTLLMPPVTHPGDHLSREAIGDAVAWFQEILQPGSPRPPMDQIWYWKSFGTLVSLIGLIVLMFPVIDWLVTLPWFSAVRCAMPETVSLRPGRVILSGLFACLVPVATFFPLQAVANIVLPANPVLPQQITNGILLWAWGNGLIMLAFFWLTHRRDGIEPTRMGFPLNRTILLRAVAVAFACCALLYAVVVLVQFLFDVDFRFWVIALRAPSPVQSVLFLIYLVPFAAFFAVLSVTLHASLGRRGNLSADMWANGLVLSVGFVVMLIAEYVPLLMGGTLLVVQPLLSIVAFQFVPLMFLVGLVSTFCYWRTGNIYTGAFINSVFVTWYMVAGTATQAVPFWF